MSFLAASGERFSVGSVVFLKAPDSTSQPYVGRCVRQGAAARTRARRRQPRLTPPARRRSVDDVVRGSDGAEGNESVKVTWFYRPEEALGGRKAFHGARELFRSDHSDTVGVASILGLATVHSLRAFLALPRPLETDFWCRFTYAAAKQTFEPKRVPVFCSCAMPFNPDLAMLECRGPCVDWYHPECLALAASGPFGERAEAARRAGAVGGAALCDALLAHESVADGRITCPACAEKAGK